MYHSFNITTSCFVFLFVLLVAPQGQALRFNLTSTKTVKWSSPTEQFDVRVPSERTKKKKTLLRKRLKRKFKRYLKKRYKVGKKQNNKQAKYIALELIGYILFGILGLWLIFTIYLASAGYLLWFILLASALALLAAAIWATIKRKQFKLANPNVKPHRDMQKQDQPDQDRFSLNNENDQQIDAMQKQTRRLRNIFLGLWLGTLIAVIFCLVLGFLLFFNAVGSILILTSLVLTPINITFFVLYLVNATKAKS